MNNNRLQSLGEFFLVGLSGTRMNREIEDFLSELNPAGLVLFARNIEEPAQVALLTHEIQRYCRALGREGVLIGIDQEGGRVNRLRTPFPVFPSALELASRKDPSAAVREFAEVTARGLRMLGITLNFVPVMDVPERPWDTRTSVIGDRAFSAEPETVMKLGLIVMDAMRSQGVIPCCKHFPGHGGTVVDSHHDLPRDERTKDQLANRDLVPFAGAIAAGCEMIMTAHVHYPALDPDYPATLSPHILQGILRDEMKFDGVVVTDDLDMGAVSARYAEEDCVVQSLAAGVDLVMFCNHPEKALRARSILAEAVRDGTISTGRLTEARRRVQMLLARYKHALTPCDVGAARQYFG